MFDDQFYELLNSAQEAGKIMPGKLKATREFKFEEPDVKAIRERIGFSQSKFAILIGVSYANTSKLGTRASPSNRIRKSTIKACSG